MKELNRFFLTTLLSVFLLGQIIFSQTANLQVIHNSAEIAADPVDIYLWNNSENNLVVKLDDFGFRTATPFVAVPAGKDLSVIIAGSGSSGANDQVIATIPVGQLFENEEYVVIANGVLDPSQYSGNPDSKSTTFELFVKAGARSQALGNNVEFFVVHGSTDAPTVDVIARDVATLVNDAAYGDVTGYLEVPANQYILDVTPANDNGTVVASFLADLNGLSGGSAVVFASGFLSPSNNQNGGAFGIFAALADGTIVEFPMRDPMANLQVIHNSAEIAADPVDVYLWNDSDGSLVLKLDDFGFRTATPYVEVPAEKNLSVVIAGRTSSGVNDQAIATIPVGQLVENEKYMVMANGVLDPSQYAPNPDSKNTDFELFVKAGVRSEAIGDKVDFFIVHGTTDAPSVNIEQRGKGALLSDVPYGAVSDYFSVKSGRYIFDITTGLKDPQKLESYVVDLNGLYKQSAVVFASGFLNPDENKDGAGFGLYAALADGTVIAFPNPSSKLQVIHNSAEIAADPIDVYLWNNAENNLVVKLDDFEFRTATPFVDVPAEKDLSVIIAGSGSSDYLDQQIASIPVGELMESENYVIMANGVLDPNAYAENPDGLNISFELLVKDGVKLAGLADNIEAFVIHGSTDAPAVDILARDIDVLVENAKYTDITGYITVPAINYTLDITPAGDNKTIVASYNANLSTLGGQSAVIFASGFLTPDLNQNGAAFGIFAALTDGTVVEFSNPNATSNLQVIHNSADIAADPVDVYLMDVMDGKVIVKLDDFGFRTATPFVEVPADRELSVKIAGSASADENDQIIATIPVGSLMSGNEYVVMANGVLDPSAYADNPDMISTGFELFVKSEAKSKGTGENVEFFVVHGSTDAPTVDVIARDVATIVDDAAYGDITSYIEVPAAMYTLDVTPGNDNSTIVASFEADLSGLGGGTAVVFASGFLNPAANQNGEAFGIYAALADGTVVEFSSVVTSVEDELSSIPTEFSLKQNYPNPFNPTTTINFALPQNELVELKVYNILGSEVATLLNENYEAGFHTISFDASQLTSGVYIYRIKAGNFVQAKKMNLIK